MAIAITLIVAWNIYLAVVVFYLCFKHKKVDEALQKHINSPISEGNTYHGVVPAHTHKG